MESALRNPGVQRNILAARLRAVLAKRNKEHERMRSPRNLLYLILILALSGLAAFNVACGGSKANVRNDAATAAPPAIDVTTAAAIRRDLPRFFQATGSLAGDQQTDVAPLIAGNVVALGVDLGSFVKRGQMIIKLDDVDLKLRVEQAQAQLDQARAALNQAQEKIGVRPGQAF